MQLIKSDMKSEALRFSGVAKVVTGQRGAALIISLVVLLVITVIGLASMNNSILQERMSANAQNARQAFLLPSPRVRTFFGSWSLWIPVQQNGSWL